MSHKFDYADLTARSSLLHSGAGTQAIVLPAGHYRVKLLGGAATSVGYISTDQSNPIPTLRILSWVGEAITPYNDVEFDINAETNYYVTITVLGTLLFTRLPFAECGQEKRQ